LNVLHNYFDDPNKTLLNNNDCLQYPSSKCQISMLISLLDLDPYYFQHGLFENIIFSSIYLFSHIPNGTIIKHRLRKSAKRCFSHSKSLQRRQYFFTRWHSESNCVGRIPYLSSKSKNTIVMGSLIGFNAGTARIPCYECNIAVDVVYSQRHSSFNDN